VSSPSEGQPISRAAWLAVTVAALGYLVDIYDLILFGVVRDASLTAIGVAEGERATIGENLLSYQMGGMLIGGILWGILGDKRGRLSVLFGSILLYSLANIANGFVTDVPTYAVLRVVAGIGLAGELGAGVTLALELIDPKRRGYATTAIAGIGICGALLAVYVGRSFDWRHAYFVGGGMGLMLLMLRVGVLESGIFTKVKETDVRRGDFLALFSTRDRFVRYVSVILVGVPVWYGVGILAINSPEITAALGATEAPARPSAILWMYTGLAVGDVGSGLLSQVLRSRKRALLAFLVLNALAVGGYFAFARDAFTTYAACFALGIANGYWAVFVTTAAEQFGTNLRATAATTAPNFVRGSLTLTTLLFQFIRAETDFASGAIIVGVLVLVLAFVSLYGIDETYGKHLDFVER
jgi:predicted MFS family arabinose efflux permease